MSLLALDAARLADQLGRTPFAVSHHVVDHPLLTVDAVAELAAALPADSVEHNVGALPDVVADGAPDRSALSPREVARTIETNGCWMVLKNIEHVREYATLLDSLLDEVPAAALAGEGGMGRREGFLFLSAPHSVTPVHMDPEHNFLLQVRGTKEMIVGSFDDRAHEQRECERYYSGRHRNLDRLPATEQDFQLAPGDGVYVPVHAPHRVRNGAGVSVSLSITFHTPATRRAAAVHAANARLRRAGLAPAPPGLHPARDLAKATALRLWRRARRPD
jgi:mannose-6-phosphate isomerase-like protein (cupin superfamily)